MISEILEFLEMQGGCYATIQPWHKSRIEECIAEGKVYVEKEDNKIVQFVAWWMISEKDLINMLGKSPLREDRFNGNVILSVDYALLGSPKRYMNLIKVLALDIEPTAKFLCFKHAHGANTGKVMLYQRTDNPVKPWRKICAVTH